MREPKINQKIKPDQAQERSQYANDRNSYRLKPKNPVKRVYSRVSVFFMVLILLVCVFASVIILSFFLNPTFSADSNNHISITSSSSLPQSNSSIEEQSAMAELRQLTASCRIKGEVIPELKAKIYILPGQKYYDQTIIRPELGERVFCSEKDAISNGWIKSKA